jgi:hypothetical protein
MVGSVVSCLCLRRDPLRDRMDPRIEPRRPPVFCVGAWAVAWGRSGGDRSKTVGTKVVEEDFRFRACS